jgi:hypothetical protein
MTSETVAPPHLKVDINYAGVPRLVAYHPHELARHLYDEAFREFHIPDGERGDLVLYLPDNTTEINPDVTEEKAGVVPDTTLVLRPRGAGGGRA